MRRTLLAALTGSIVLFVAGCAQTVGGTAEVGPGAAVPPSGSSSVQSLPDVSGSTSAGSSTEITQPTGSSSGESSGTDSTAASTPESSAPESTDTTAGTSTADTSTDSPTETSTAASSSTTSTSTSKSAPATSSSARSRKATLHCAVGAIQPSGGPFCYPVPSGFLDVSTKAVYPGTDQYKSALALQVANSSRDLIFVTASTLSTNSDSLSDAVIKQALAEQFDAGIPDTTNVTPLKQLSVAGDRAFESDITFTDGSQKRYLLVFSGVHRVSVSCQWLNHAAEIAVGCTAVLKSLQIANP